MPSHPPRHSHLISGPVNLAILHGKGDVADVVKDLEIGDYPRLSGKAQSNYNSTSK